MMVGGTMKTAAIYARVSSDRQKEQHTIASQTAALKEYARQEGFTVPEPWVFEDEGYSGSTLVRPGLEQMRDLAAEGQLEAMLVYSPDRLSRKYAYQILLTEEFSRHGVEVIFLRSPQTRSPEDQLVLQFQGMIAEYERAQIAERSRRGKRHRAQGGSVNVLSGAPYGYRYVKKTESSAAYYQVIENEAETVRTVYELYTREALSINGIARWLNEQGIPTRRRTSRWERSTVWAMLRNPAYIGKACYGKTRSRERKKVTRPLRQRGGFSPRCSANQEQPHDEWIEIPVPAIIDEGMFALAQERLEQNKRYSPRRTLEPTLLQGMLVCNECGYAFSRCSTRTSKRKIYYYRCIGSDDYRFENGRVCQNRPIRQDYLDDVVWKQVVQLLENPQLITLELERRIKQIQDSAPTRRRKATLNREITRARKGIAKLLDAYQEGLLDLSELRQRMPELRKREQTLAAELHRVESAAIEQEKFARLAEDVQGFLARLHSSADTLGVTERQRVMRLVVKEVLVGPKSINLRHSIPVVGDSSPRTSSPGAGGKPPGYLLRSGSNQPASCQSLPSLCV
jgi:site-specific DNA recombinase